MRIIHNALFFAAVLSLNGCSKKLSQKEYKKESDKLSKKETDLFIDNKGLDLADDSEFRAFHIDARKKQLKEMEGAFKRLKKSSKSSD